MAQKKQFLHELLKEDQEPFLLNNYIAEKRCELKRASFKYRLQINKNQIPVSDPSSIFAGNFCKNACFLFSSSSSTLYDSPDVRKSPLFEKIQSPLKSPCKSPNTIFLPAKTSALLLEAALRIHKQTSKSKARNGKSQGFGLFGSFFKRNRNQNMSLMDGERTACEKSCCSNSCKNEQMSNLEASRSKNCCSSSRHYEDPEVILELLSTVRNDCENDFCQSPFHFVLQQSSSSGCRTPEFPSPASSPARLKHEEKKINYEVEEEENKEQCSPVSVLDHPFEDDDDDHHDGDQINDRDYDLECSYAIVQRAKQQLLNRVRRFEKLAELDPVKLEKIMSEPDHEDDVEEFSDNEETDGNNTEWLIQDVIESSSLCCGNQMIPKDMKKLVTDLIAEEQSCSSGLENVTEEVVVKRACKKLMCWKEVEFNTIDMMVEEDMKTEVDWRTSRRSRNQSEEDVEESAFEIEVVIFSHLVEDLAMELACTSSD